VPIRFAGSLAEGVAADWFELAGEFAFAVTAGDALAELLEAVSLALHPANKNSSEVRVIDKATCVLFILCVDRVFELSDYGRDGFCCSDLRFGF
jgi:hypothetical protein